jgi:hypothetical protein
MPANMLTLLEWFVLEIRDLQANVWPKESWIVVQDNEVFARWVPLKKDIPDPIVGTWNNGYPLDKKERRIRRASSGEVYSTKKPDGKWQYWYVPFQKRS